MIAADKKHGPQPHGGCHHVVCDLGCCVWHGGDSNRGSVVATSFLAATRLEYTVVEGFLGVERVNNICSGCALFDLWRMAWLGGSATPRCIVYRYRGTGGFIAKASLCGGIACGW